MLRTAASRAFSAVQGAVRLNVQRSISVSAARLQQQSAADSKEVQSTIFKLPHKISDAEFDELFIAYFNREDIDGWELRKVMKTLHDEDVVPEPQVITAALKACRRLNEFSLAVRYLESVKFKCGNNVKTIWPWLVQELRPTLDELGVPTPEEIGYDKPELWKQDVYDMH